jgi:L-histidine N-alpha-methyltransferase
MITDAAPALTEFAEDVRHYLQLSPRQLPSRYLYDRLGSALFDSICELPWYRITHAESTLLTRHRRDILRHFPDLTRIVELGPGDGRKLQQLVSGITLPLSAYLIDVSGGALARATQALSEAANINVVALECSYEDGLDAIARLDDDSTTLVLLLGSNIGNFDPPVSSALLRRIHEMLPVGGALVIGADLVKPERDLLLAYDDPLGVSAAFNRNLLVRINRELAGTFDVRAFRHQAVWNALESRMEMSLVSMIRQRVRIDAIGLELAFAEGEHIWTESSYKYTPRALQDLLNTAGFTCVERWTDQDAGFSVSLAHAFRPT